MKLEEVLAFGGPWYGLRTDEQIGRRISGFGGGTDGANLHLWHEWRYDSKIEVETRTENETYDPEAHAISNYLANVIFPTSPPRTFPMSFEVRRRIVGVRVNGTTIDFVFVGNDPRWNGYSSVGERFVRIEAYGRDIEGLELIEVDPADYAPFDRH